MPYLIFMRHGKAESTRIGGSDFDRALTEKGREKLHQSCPQIAALMTHLMPAADWRVLTSPKRRAAETADILAEHVHVGHPQIVPALAIDDLDAVLEAVWLNEDKGLCMVGHQPQLSYWIYALTGQSIPMRKGAAVAVDYAPKRMGKNPCLWHFETY